MSYESLYNNTCIIQSCFLLRPHPFRVLHVFPFQPLPLHQCFHTDPHLHHWGKVMQTLGSKVGRENIPTENQQQSLGLREEK